MSTSYYINDILISPTVNPVVNVQWENLTNSTAEMLISGIFAEAIISDAIIGEDIIFTVSTSTEAIQITGTVYAIVNRTGSSKIALNNITISATSEALGSIVIGPETSVIGNIPIFSSITGNALEDSGYDISDFAPVSEGVTNGDSHNHVGGDGATLSHTNLSDIGTNLHTVIDSFIASKAQVNGLASLNSSSKVVQDPANATSTPTQNKIPIANGVSGTLATGWIPDLSGTYAPTANGVTNGDSHDHSGGDGASIPTTSTTFSATSRILGRKTTSGGAGEECTLSEVLDFVGSPARGELIRRGASTWEQFPKGDQGTILYAGADDPTYLAVGTKGQVLATQGASANPVWLDKTPGLYYNAIINPQFQVNQRALAVYTSATDPANSDDTYLLDQWVLLSDGNDIVDVSQETAIVPSGAATALKLEVETANKKFGKIFFLENKDALKFAGKAVSLQFKARTTTGKAIRNIRAAVLSWSSTADTLTSDVVDAWGAEGNNPTLVANWTAENVAANLALIADTWTTYKIENIAIDTASMANLAVFIWCDDADAAVDDLLYLGDVQLNEGPVCLPFMPMKFNEELLRCCEYYQKSHNYNITPTTSDYHGAMYTQAYNTYDVYTNHVTFGIQMRSNPVVHLYSPTTGAADKVADTTTGDITPSTTVGYTVPGQTGFTWSAGGNSAAGHFIFMHWVAIAEL